MCVTFFKKNAYYWRAQTQTQTHTQTSQEAACKDQRRRVKGEKSARGREGRRCSCRPEEKEEKRSCDGVER